jgi:hypothetical protein
MKITTRILSVITVICTIVAFSFVASAATKEDIINKLESSKIPVNYIALAQDYLKSNSFTSNQYGAALANVGKVIDVMNAENVTDPTKLSAAAKSQVLSIINDTADRTGITATVGKDAKGESYLRLTGSGNNTFEVTASDLGLKVTGGNDYISFIILSIGLILMALGSAFIIARKTAVKA